MSRFTLYDDNLENGSFLIYNNEDRTYYYVSKALALVQASYNSYYPLFSKAFFYNTVTVDIFSDIHLQMPKSIQDWITYLNGFVSPFIEIVSRSGSSIGDSLYFLVMKQKVFHELLDLDNGLTLCCSYFQANYDSSDFETDLYPELLDNEETKLSLQRWIADGSPSWDTYSDKDIKAMELIEKYNKNVLLLRSTRKVEIDKEISLSSDSSSDVDLSPVVQQLSNINNKLQTTEIIDNTQKSITDVLNQQANTIQVDEIGLLRSKKGYY